MKDKKLFKRWWFWLIVIIIFGAIGSLSQGNKKDDIKPPEGSQVTVNTEQNTATLPKLNIDDYKGKEGLGVYKDLKRKGYSVSADFEKQALTDINGKASELFETLDPNKPEDKQSVDAFVVTDLKQNGDHIALTIALRSS